MGGTADTVIVNHVREVRIPVRVFNSDGDSLPDSSVSYRWVGGDEIPVSADGRLTCKQSADARVQASLAGISTTMLVRCRPVERIYIAGPLQFILPDTAQTIRVRALGPDGNDVDLLKGTAQIRDTSAATIDGVRIIPKAAGASVAWVRFGNRSAGVGVHVYDRVSTLDALRDGKRMVGIPLSIQSGEMRSWHLPPGTWMLTMLPESDENAGLRLSIEGATCVASQLTKRRLVCLVKSDAIVRVYSPFSTNAGEHEGQLLVRRVNS